MRATGKKKYLAFTFIMQNIAANLGGMVTPLKILKIYIYFHILILIH